MFNHRLHKFFENQHQRFRDHVGIQAKFEELKQVIATQPVPDHLVTAFMTSIQPHEGEIARKNEALFEHCTIFAEWYVPDVWPRMVQAERDEFWQMLAEMKRLYYIADTCGDQIDDLKKVTADIFQPQPGMNQEQQLKQIMSTLATDKNAQQSVMDILFKGNMLSKMVANMENIMGDVLPMQGIMKMMGEANLAENQDELKSMMSSMTGANPTTLLSAMNRPQIEEEEKSDEEESC